MRRAVVAGVGCVIAACLIAALLVWRCVTHTGSSDYSDVSTASSVRPTRLDSKRLANASISGKVASADGAPPVPG